VAEPQEQEHLTNLLAPVKGSGALLRDQEVIEFYPTLEDAYRDGLAGYPDRRFSIQEVIDAPLRMGRHAIAA